MRAVIVFLIATLCVVNAANMRATIKSFDAEIGTFPYVLLSMHMKHNLWQKVMMVNLMNHLSPCYQNPCSSN